MSKKTKKAARKIAKADVQTTHKAAAKRDTPVMRVLATLAEAADQPPLIVASLGTIAVGLATRRGEVARGGARMLAAHLVATAGKTLLKRSIDRTRPKKALRDGKHHAGPGDSHDHELNSFPSGHTAGAVAVARAASRDIEGAAVPATIGAVAVAALQPAAGNHYITDVIAGAVIGWLAEAAVSALFDRTEATIRAA